MVASKSYCRDSDRDALWQQYHHEILLRQPLSLLSDAVKDRVLDIGSGDGCSLEIIESYGCRPVGLDLSPGGSPVVRGTATSLPFKDGSVQIIVCLRTLQHIQDEDKAIREMKRVLSTDGFLVLAVANLKSITLVQLKSKGAWRGRERIPYEWFKAYSESEITKLVETHGFRPIDVKIVGYAPEIIRRRFPTVSKLMLRIVMKMETCLRALPFLGTRGTHVRVIARRIKTDASSSAKLA